MFYFNFKSKILVAEQLYTYPICVCLSGCVSPVFVSPKYASSLISHVCLIDLINFASLMKFQNLLHLDINIIIGVQYFQYLLFISYENLCLELFHHRLNISGTLSGHYLSCHFLRPSVVPEKFPVRKMRYFQVQNMKLG